jgi:hypothetical protein
MPVIHLQNVESLWIGFRKLIEEPLIALGIHMRKLQAEGVSRCWFNRTIEPECFEQPLPLADRFHSISCNQPTDQGMKSKGTFILSKVDERPLILAHLTSVLAQQLKFVCKVL